MKTIGTSYELIAGHYLPKVPDGHKCRRPHGHNYRIEIMVTGRVQNNGFIIDFYNIEKIVKPLLDQLDHTMLNEHEGLENPTAENISGWFLEKLSNAIPEEQWSVKVWETPTCWALSTYSGDELPPALR
jgi:6-pyruvoyltetrahydropterin/6-carboxytetrahydropterin synthase